MNFVFTPAAMPTIPVTGDATLDHFPVRRIYCVGQNYAAHAIEMGHSGREAPFFFMKPADAVLPVADGVVGLMSYPPLTRNLHHEVELVVAIGQGGQCIAVEQALEYVFGYAVGLDMTRRDLQAEAKKQGRPWSVAKGFDQSAPISPIRPSANCTLHADTAISLSVNTQPRQASVLGQLIWSVPEIIAQLSQAFTLQPGDLIFTGTPEGVGPVVVGDTLTAHIEGVGRLALQVVSP